MLLQEPADQYYFVTQTVAKSLGNLLARRQHVLKASLANETGDRRRTERYDDMFKRLDYAIGSLEGMLALFVHF